MTEDILSTVCEPVRETFQRGFDSKGKEKEGKEKPN
jgi:hypothetical protein